MMVIIHGDYEVGSLARSEAGWQSTIDIAGLVGYDVVGRAEYWNRQTQSRRRRKSCVGSIPTTSIEQTCLSVGGSAISRSS